MHGFERYMVDSSAFGVWQWAMDSHECSMVSVGGVISVRSPFRKAAMLTYWAEVLHEQLDLDWYA